MMLIVACFALQVSFTLRLLQLSFVLTCNFFCRSMEQACSDQAQPVEPLLQWFTEAQVVSALSKRSELEDRQQHHLGESEGAADAGSSAFSIGE